MQELAKRYKGRVQTWIIGNEVDIPTGQWRTWDGSMEDYAQLMAVAYRAIKAGNPAARSRATTAPRTAAFHMPVSDSISEA